MIKFCTVQNGTHKIYYKLPIKDANQSTAKDEFFGILEVSDTFYGIENYENLQEIFILTLDNGKFYRIINMLNPENFMYVIHNSNIKVENYTDNHQVDSIDIFDAIKWGKGIMKENEPIDLKVWENHMSAALRKGIETDAKNQTNLQTYRKKYDINLIAGDIEQIDEYLSLQQQVYNMLLNEPGNEYQYTRDHTNTKDELIRNAKSYKEQLKNNKNKRDGKNMYVQVTKTTPKKVNLTFDTITLEENRSSLGKLRTSIARSVSFPKRQSAPVVRRTMGGKKRKSYKKKRSRKRRKSHRRKSHRRKRR